jgi:hypothetical protein
MSEPPLNQKKFLEKVKDVPNILIGNGFSLSHPDLGKAFKWDMNAAFCSSWNSVLPRKSDSCPEADLAHIRVELLNRILEFYIEELFEAMPGSGNNHDLYNLHDNYKKNGHNCSEFLRKRKNIFTLNYDPIMYFEILKLFRKDSCDDYGDGFDGDKFITQEQIKSRLSQKGQKIFYLHGSWFIQCDFEERDGNRGAHSTAKCNFVEIRNECFGSLYWCFKS